MKEHYIPVQKDSLRAFVDGRWVKCDFVALEPIDTSFYDYLGVCTQYKKDSSKGEIITEKKGFVYKWKTIKV